MVVLQGVLGSHWGKQRILLLPLGYVQRAGVGNRTCISQSTSPCDTDLGFLTTGFQACWYLQGYLTEVEGVACAPAS